MENRNGTVDRMVEQLTDPRGDFATPATTAERDSSTGIYTSRGYSSELTTVPDGPASESLYGSLSVFALSDVLSLLASTIQTGELQVVRDGAQGWLWFDQGDLVDAEVGSTTTVNQAFFELACVTGGWFSFTSDRVSAETSSSGGTQPGARVPVATVLAEVGPQVEEWRAIRQLLPLEAVVTLSSEPPGEDVRIRNDQWHVLTPWAPVAIPSSPSLTPSAAIRSSGYEPSATSIPQDSSTSSRIRLLLRSPTPSLRPPRRRPTRAPSPPHRLSWSRPPIRPPTSSPSHRPTRGQRSRGQ